jgi:hypothetical protein
VNTENSSKSLWLRSYTQGFTLACNHRVFIVLTLFAVCGERAFSFYLSYTGKTLKETIVEYSNLITSTSWLSPTLSMNGSTAAHLKILFPFIILFLIGWFVLAGLFGLIRDQITCEFYETKDVLKYGRSFFWPIFKFKISIYLTQGLTLLLSAAILIPLAGKMIFFSLVAVPVVIINIGFFVTCLVMLSLGAKLIVIDQIFSMASIYRRLLQMITVNFRDVALFYSLFLLLSIIGIAVPFLFNITGMPSLPLTIGNIFFLSFLTVVMHASTIFFLLQLQINSSMEIFRNG